MSKRKLSMLKQFMLLKLLIAASGALGRIGDGWIWGTSLIPGVNEYLPVLKTQGLHRQKGRPFWKSYWPLFLLRGSVNAMALPWPSLRFFLKFVLPRVKRKCILSLHAKNAAEMEEMVRMIKADRAEHPEKYRWIKAVEINLSCPNVDAPFQPLGILKEASALPYIIIAKIGDRQVGIAIRAARRGWIQVVAVINTVLWHRLFPGKISPLFKRLGVSGGVAGAPIREIALLTVRKLAKARKRQRLDFMIIGGGGITDVKSAQMFLDAGADRLVVGTLLTQNIIGAMILAWWWRKKKSRSLTR